MRRTTAAAGAAVVALGVSGICVGPARAAGPAQTQTQTQTQTSQGSMPGNLLTMVQRFAPAGTLDAARDPASLYSLTQSLGARALWLRGITGQGVGVALIDSGVAAVPGLSVTDGPDLSSTAGTSTQSRDGYGHGTAMAGIIAGHDPGLVSGLLAPLSSSFDGIAPNATLINIKVAESDGWTDPSRVIAAIAWVVQHHNDPGHLIRVINLSYGTDSAQPYLSDPVAYAVEQAWKAGIVVVASAGNDGSTPTHLLNPALDPYVIAVGAATTATAGSATVPSFDSLGDGTRNPDVLAPGVSIQSLRAPGSVIDQALTASGSSGRFLKGTGTSESSAIVTGMVALLLQARPSLTPDQVKAILTGTAHPLPAVNVRAQGYGLADVSLAALLPTPAHATQTWAASLGNGSLDASRGSESWVAAGATTAQAENPALMGGPSGTAWADRAWAGRSWAGATWAADGGSQALSGRSWSGRSWS